METNFATAIEAFVINYLLVLWISLNSSHLIGEFCTHQLPICIILNNIGSRWHLQFTPLLAKQKRVRLSACFASQSSDTIVFLFLAESGEKTPTTFDLAAVDMRELVLSVKKTVNSSNEMEPTLRQLRISFSRDVFMWFPTISDKNGDLKSAADELINVRWLFNFVN